MKPKRYKHRRKKYVQHKKPRKVYVLDLPKRAWWEMM